MESRGIEVDVLMIEVFFIIFDFEDVFWFVYLLRKKEFGNRIFFCGYCSIF